MIFSCDNESVKNHMPVICLQTYDFTQVGVYHITLVTFGYRSILSKISFDDNHLTQIGKIVFQEWLRIPNRFNNVKLDEFVIMPNHLHAIILITGHNKIRGVDGSQIDASSPVLGRFSSPVSTSIPTIMRWFKSTVSLRFHRLTATVGIRLWQHNYYEHILHDNEELDRIRIYILDNPRRWMEDDLNK